MNILTDSLDLNHLQHIHCTYKTFPVCLKHLHTYFFYQLDKHSWNCKNTPAKKETRERERERKIRLIRTARSCFENHNHISRWQCRYMAIEFPMSVIIYGPWKTSRNSFIEYKGWYTCTHGARFLECSGYLKGLGTFCNTKDNVHRHTLNLHCLKIMIVESVP